MKKRVYIITALASYIVLLIATIPASAINGFLNDNTPVKIRGTSGTLWKGKALSASFNNSIHLQTTEWSFNTWKLLTGQVSIDVETQYLNNSVQSEIGVSFFGQYFANDLSAIIDANEIARLAQIPLVQLSGMVSLNIEHAHWKQGELPVATGRVNWKDAAIAVTDTASLGNVSIVLSESDQQLLNADITNQGGDIKISGSAELVPEANYALNLKLTPTPSANNNIKQSLGLFAKKQNDGDYVLKKSGPLNQIM